MKILQSAKQADDPGASKDMRPAMDPVCGMTIDPQTAAGSMDYNGRTYFFCSVGCLNRFRAEPERFVNRLPKAPAPQPARSVQPVTTAPSTDEISYTCPMHPQIVRNTPGNCPICGMALEPRTISLTDEENPELVDMRRRFWVSLVLTIPLLIIGMSE